MVLKHCKLNNKWNETPSFASKGCWHPYCCISATFWSSLSVIHPCILSTRPLQVRNVNLSTVQNALLIHHPIFLSPSASSPHYTASKHVFCHFQLVTSHNPLGCIPTMYSVLFKLLCLILNLVTTCPFLLFHVLVWLTLRCTGQMPPLDLCFPTLLPPLICFFHTILLPSDFDN